MVFLTLTISKAMLEISSQASGSVRSKQQVRQMIYLTGIGNSHVLNCLETQPFQARKIIWGKYTKQTYKTTLYYEKILCMHFKSSPCIESCKGSLFTIRVRLVN